MNKNSNKNDDQTSIRNSEENRQPAYLAPDYPYQPAGDPICDPADIASDSGLYELRCSECTFVMRSQGKNMQKLFDKMNDSGCPYCQATEPFVIRRVDRIKG